MLGVGVVDRSSVCGVGSRWNFCRYSVVVSVGEVVGVLILCIVYSNNRQVFLGGDIVRQNRQLANCDCEMCFHAAKSAVESTICLAGAICIGSLCVCSGVKCLYWAVVWLGYLTFGQN